MSVINPVSGSNSYHSSPRGTSPVRWLDLTTATGEPATRIDLDPLHPAPVPDVTATPNAHSPGEPGVT